MICRLVLLPDDLASLSLPACPRTDYTSDHFEEFVTWQKRKLQFFKLMLFRAQCWPSAASWFALGHFLYGHMMVHSTICKAVFLAYHRALEWLPALAVCLARSRIQVEYSEVSSICMRMQESI